MNKLVILYIFFAILVLLIGVFTFTFPTGLLPSVTFNPFIHIIFEASIALLALFIFIRGNQIYTRTQDRRIAIISGGFLAGSLLKLFHIFTSYEFPYDVLTWENYLANPEILYLIIGDMIFATSIFMSTFYSREAGEKLNSQFRRKVYAGFLIFSFLIIVLDGLLRPVLLPLIQAYTYKFILIDASLETALKALYILSALIYADIRLTCRNSVISKFILGLFILGIGQLFFIIPSYLVALYGIYGHSAQAIGFLLILIGLHEIPQESGCVSFRQKFSAYLSIFLIAAYLIFVTFTSVVFNIRFPSFAPYIFLEFFIIAMIIQYALSTRFIAPINNITQGVEQFKPGEKTEKIPVTTRDEIGLLTSRINNIIDLNWEYTQELLSRQEQDKITLSIINKIRSAITPNEVLNGVVTIIGDVFEPEECILFDYDNKASNIYPAQFEYRKSPDIPSLIGRDFSELTGFEQLYNIIVDRREFIAISDIDQEDIDESVKIFFKSIGIKSVLILPLSYKNEVLGSLVLSYFNEPHNWSQDTINLIKVLEPQISTAIYQAKLYTSTSEIARREKLLRQIMVASIRSLNIQDALKSIVTQVGEVFNADRCFFVAYNVESNEYKTVEDYEVYISSLEIKDIAGTKFINEQMAPFTKIVIDQDRVLAVNDTNKLEVPELTKQIIKEFNVKSFIISPISYREVPLGILVLHYVNSYKQFSQAEINLISAISDQSAVVIHQAQLYDQLQDRSNRERLLRAIINEVLTSANQQEAVQSIAAEVGKLFDADRVAIRFFDPNYRIFSEVVGEYRNNENVPTSIGKGGYPSELDEYMAHELFDQKKILVINDIEDPKYPEVLKEVYRDLGVKSTVAAPVFYQDTPIAAIYVTNTVPTKEWNKSDIDLLGPIVQQISIGINLFRLNEKLRNSLDNERMLRQMITEARSFTAHDEIYDYLLVYLTRTFNVKRGLHLHSDEHNNLYVQNEDLQQPEMFKSLYKQVLLSAESTVELKPYPTQAIIIYDVAEEIQNTALREYLLSNKIQAIMLYPSAKKAYELLEESVTGTTLITSETPRKWTSDEVDLFKLMIDTVSIIFFEQAQRQELDETRRTFIATLTHDLRSPIIAEQKAIEFITSRDLSTELRNYIEYMQDIYSTNEELLRIVNNMLSVYHYESGKIALTLQAGNIQDTIEAAVRSLKHFAKSQESDITMDIQPDLPLVMMDQTEINRVLVNLISNAIKHNKKGTQIIVAAKKADNEVQVSVSDNGRGIPEESKPKIFQRYPTTKREIGSGLGLYLSKQIIEEHDGRIWFESEVDKGTTFYFSLPVA
ncbi:MAG: two-component sensor histidine kinase [uncultured bacterium]|nr:MAG: two-component sensor histidine kinase [uncultured bacterium]